MTNSPVGAIPCGWVSLMAEPRTLHGVSSGFVRGFDKASGLGHGAVGNSGVTLAECVFISSPCAGEKLKIS